MYASGNASPWTSIRDFVLGNIPNIVQKYIYSLLLAVIVSVVLGIYLNQLKFCSLLLDCCPKSVIQHVCDRLQQSTYTCNSVVIPILLGNVPVNDLEIVSLLHLAYYLQWLTCV